MYKVEITGVNTSELKTIKNEKMMELIKLSKEGDLESREELIMGNLKLVLSVCKKFQNRKSNLDDIFQVGVIGLIKAIDNFELSHNVRFSTYAVPMIIGEIRRYLRDNSIIKVSRSMKDLAYKALSFKDMYIKEKMKEPSIKEICEGCECEEIDLVIALEAIQDPISIYTPIYNNGSDEIYLIDQIGDENENNEKLLLKMQVEKGMKRLTKRQKHIIDERYYNNKTQMEIAKEIGISQAQVSRLEKNALKVIFE